MQADGVGAHGLLSDAQLHARMDLFNNAAAVSFTPHNPTKVADATCLQAPFNAFCLHMLRTPLKPARSDLTESPAQHSKAWHGMAWHALH